MVLLTLTTEEPFICHDVNSVLTAGVTGWGSAGDKHVIPVTQSSDTMEEACGEFILMTVLDLFKGEIYHLGLK